MTSSLLRKCATNYAKPAHNIAGDIYFSKKSQNQATSPFHSQQSDVTVATVATVATSPFKASRLVHSKRRAVRNKSLARTVVLQRRLGGYILRILLRGSRSDS